MAKIHIKQINNTPADLGGIVVFDGSNNVWSNNDDGAVLVSKGTTAQRPGTPTEGMIRYNTSNNCLESYVNGAWVCLSNTGTTVGSIFSFDFFLAGSGNNKWLDYVGGGIVSAETPAVMPWGASLIGITFSNRIAIGDTGVEIYATPEGVEPSITQTLKFSWTPLTNVRTARKTDFVSPPTFDAGDKIGVFTRVLGDSISDPAVVLYFAITTNTSEESLDSTSGFMMV